MTSKLKTLHSLIIGTFVLGTMPLKNLRGQVRPYSLSDLAVLESEKDTEEFFKHYRDIRPSERQKVWREMTLNMGVIWVEKLIVDKKFGQKDFDLLHERSKTPPFQEDELFQFTKRKYLSLYFAKCFEMPEKACSNNLNLALATTQLESQWSYDLLTKHLNKLNVDQVRTLNKNILQSSDALIFCGKKDFFAPLLRQYVEAKITENDLQKNLTLSLVTKSCRLKIKEYQAQILQLSPRDKRLDSFLFLEELGNIGPKEREIFYVTYALDNAEIGDTFNLAWNFIQGLAENYKKRDELLTELNKLPNLPGETVFKNPNYERHSAIIHLFKKNFPEYLDNYAQSCLKHLNGEKISGNPKACHEFFSFKGLDPKWKNSYLKLKTDIEGTKIINRL